MAQQQLLLLVLGVIVVGIAIIVGMNVLDDKFRESERDALIERCASIATYAVMWKNSMHNKMAGNTGFEGLAVDGLQKLHVTDEGMREQVAIAKADALELEIVAVSKRYPEVGVKMLVRGDKILETEVRMDGTIQILDIMQ